MEKPQALEARLLLHRKHPFGRKNLMKKLSLIVFGGLAAFLLFGGLYVLSWMQRPLDPPLELDVPPTLMAVLPASGKLQTQPTNPALNCGNSGQMPLILLGVNMPEIIGHAGADAVRLMVVDFDNMAVNSLALPADLWVETPEDLVDELGPMASLNMIYYQAREDASGNTQVIARKATQVVTQVIVDTFGFVPDKYVHLEGEPFIDLVNELGGITVFLQNEVDGTPENYGVFPAGNNDLDGQRALDFVRLLHPKGGPNPDYFGRFQRQNLAIWAIFDALTQPTNWDNLPDLLKDARKMVTTDLSVDQARDLSCMLDEVGQDAQLLFVEEEMVHYDAEGHMLPDVPAIKKLVEILYGE
jgi:LCP family protein required for cell wall assembly